MLCPMCNGNLVKITGSLYFETKTSGSMPVPNVSYLKCQSCEEITIDFETTKTIHSFITRMEEKAIAEVPISKFVTLNEAAVILGISKQAFSKNSRINRGFIYSVKIGNSKFYLRASVEEFQKTGKDGRIRINPPILRAIEVPKYIFISSLQINEPTYSGGFLSFDAKSSDMKSITIQ